MVEGLPDAVAMWMVGCLMLFATLSPFYDHFAASCTVSTPTSLPCIKHRTSTHHPPRYLKLLDRKGGIQTLRSKHLAGRVDPPLDLFTAPPLRSDADSVWYPEWGKAWQYWGVPRYGF